LFINVNNAKIEYLRFPGGVFMSVLHWLLFMFIAVLSILPLARLDLVVSRIMCK